MSLVDRQKTCVVCGKPFLKGQPTSLEPLIDGGIRYVAVHWGESTLVDAAVKRVIDKLSRERMDCE